ncbi:hypothetical protein NC651_035032 [Populus alba x Populus x berolinensis]|nr:hypothetical protein NC651_035032 [Populus alba x Populus x berolinensis]
MGLENTNTITIVRQTKHQAAYLRSPRRRAPCEDSTAIADAFYSALERAGGDSLENVYQRAVGSQLEEDQIMQEFTTQTWFN